MDLAKLVVRLEAQSAQLLTELEKANRSIGRFEKNAGSSLDRINKKFTAFGFGIKAAIGTFLGGITFGAIVNASAEAAVQFAKLENAVEKAGAAAGGRTAQDFKKAAGEIANLTTQTGGAVQNVQQLLLRFQNIRTDRFDEATKRVLDLSEAIGVDLDTAAKMVGRALSDPIKGVQALAKAGVVLSDGQKETIKNLVETGRRAEAQGLILDALGKKYGGAAEAARNNFGGALKAVKNALGDLMEGEGGLPEATKAMNELATTLQDPAVKAGADALFSTIVSGAAKAASFLGKTAAGIEVILSKGSTRLEQLQKQIDFLEEERDSVPLVLNLGSKNDIFPEGGFGALGPSGIDEKIKELRGQMDEILQLGERGAEAAKKIKTAIADTGGAFELPDIEVVDHTAELAAAAEKLQKALEASGKAMTERVQTPWERFQATIAEADKLLAANIITVETWTRAVTAAAEDVDPFLAAIVSINDEAADLTDTLDKAMKDLDADLQSSTNDILEGEMKGAFDEFDKVLEKSKTKLDVFSEEASRNVQNILADGIVDGLEHGFDHGLKGLLESFTQMLVRMSAQAVAADIAGKIFGEEGVGSGGGFFGQAVDFIGGLFGGSRDSGGPGAAGQPVMIGRGAQPELFVPDSAGQFYPNGSWNGGGGNVTQNIYPLAPITQRSARQLELEAARRQRTAQARIG